MFVVHMSGLRGLHTAAASKLLIQALPLSLLLHYFFLLRMIQFLGMWINSAGEEIHSPARVVEK